MPFRSNTDSIITAGQFLRKEGCLTVGFEDDDGLRLDVSLVKFLAQLVPLPRSTHLLRVEVVLPEDHAVTLILENWLWFSLCKAQEEILEITPSSHYQYQNHQLFNLRRTVTTTTPRWSLPVHRSSVATGCCGRRSASRCTRAVRPNPTTPSAEVFRLVP